MLTSRFSIHRIPARWALRETCQGAIGTNSDVFAALDALSCTLRLYNNILDIAILRYSALAALSVLKSCATTLPSRALKHARDLTPFRLTCTTPLLPYVRVNALQCVQATACNADNILFLLTIRKWKLRGGAQSQFSGQPTPNVNTHLGVNAHKLGLTIKHLHVMLRVPAHRWNADTAPNLHNNHLH